MCCEQCGRYPCASAVTLRAHAARHGGLPAPHYHLCKNTAPCDYACGPCGRLVKEVSTPPLAHFQYGCCHQCSLYSQCRDYADRHVKGAGSFLLPTTRPQTAQEARDKL